MRTRSVVLLLAGLSGLILAVRTWGGGGGDAALSVEPDDDARSVPADGGGPPASSPGATSDGGAMEDGLIGGRDLRPTKGSGSIVAHVVRASDQMALSNILVRVVGASGTGGALTLRQWSDVRGEVRFDDVPTGEAWTVRAQREALPPVERSGVAVRAGETTDVGTLALESIGIVDVLVLDEKREPIVGATVSVSFVVEAVRSMDDSPWPLEGALPGELAHGTTDDRGRVRLEGVAPGPVAVRATSPALRGRTVRAFVPPEAPRTAFVPFVLVAGTSYGGRVVDRSGAGIAGAKVEFGFERVETFEVRATTSSGDDGSFAMRGCEPIEGFALRVSAKEYATVVVEPTAPRWARGDGPRSFPRAPVVVVLDRGATLAVMVLDAAARTPVEGARVRVAFVGPNAPPPGLAAPRVLFEAKSDVRGVAAIEVPTRAIAEIEIVDLAHRTMVAPGAGRSGVAGGELTGDRSTPIAPGERRELTAALLQGHTLVATVRDDAFPTQVVPVPGARVVLRHGDRTVGEAVSDHKGRVEFKDSLLPDRAPTLDVVAAGFYPGTEEVRGPPNKDGVVRATVSLHALERPLTVTGTVLDASGAPVEGALVQLIERGKSTLTGADGTFRLDHVSRRIDPREPGPAELPIVVTKDAGRIEASVEVPKPTVGDEIRLGTKKLEAVADITGVVMLGRTSDRVRYPWIELLDVDTGRVLDAQVAGEFGDYRFPGLVTGTYRLRARDAANGGGRTVQVRYSRSIPTFVEVRIIPATICAGRLEDRNGKPLADVALRLDCNFLPSDALGDRSLSETTVVTDAVGGFRFRCFGARPAGIHAKLDFDRGRGPEEWSEHVDPGEDNVVRVKRLDRRDVK